MTTDYTPLHGRGSRRTGLLATVVLVVGAVLLGGGLLLGRATANASSAAAALAAGSMVLSPHGPAMVVDGIPAGYPRDRAGAATAAVNFLQTCWSAASGVGDVERIRAVMAAANPSAEVLKTIGQGRVARDDSGQQLTPAAVTVRSQDQQQAVVSVWAVSAYGGTVGNKTRTTGMWFTFTVALSWEQGDWKVADLSVADGPDDDGAGGENLVPLTGALTVYLR
ncbi:hypothetical protein [Nakamurella endophytica]|uniref:DUF8175 domain-containing protein n=1 Tax=Nakamurella endophytica TaxID=1748367 RepID=A0A917WJ80_9ACTN|nr:hypothetical protein [Nakamurella endophytica]GGM09984.1 hypothetical protein GCM10011594_32360 [Nakamurella endophytica]